MIDEDHSIALAHYVRTVHQLQVLWQQLVDVAAKHELVAQEPGREAASGRLPSGGNREPTYNNTAGFDRQLVLHLPTIAEVYVEAGRPIEMDAEVDAGSVAHGAQLARLLPISQPLSVNSLVIIIDIGGERCRLCDSMMTHEALSALRTKSRSRRAWSAALARALRRDARISQSDAARALGVSTSAVCRWETGEREPRGDQGERYLAILRQIVGEDSAA